MNSNTVGEAMDLLKTEVQHFENVVKTWEESKQPKVRGQTYLKTRCLGKTKKSSCTRKIHFKQLKIENFLQKQKKRKLCISSNSSEELLERVQALGDQSSLPGVRAEQQDLVGIEPLSDSSLTTDSEATNGNKVDLYLKNKFFYNIFRPWKFQGTQKKEKLASVQKQKLCFILVL